MSGMMILFQLIQKPHFELMPDEQILMAGLVQVVSMRLNIPNFQVIIILGQIVKGALQSDCVSIKVISVR